MNRSKPPALASWLLEHLTRRTQNDALAGDLLEEFRSGRSAAWFWRQVLLAILASVASALRGASFALGFAFLWTLGAPLWGRYFFPSQIHKLLQLAPSWYAYFQWPWSTIFEISLLSTLTAIPVVVGMSLYIVVSRQFSRRRLFFAVLLAFVLQAARILALPGIVHHSVSFSIASQFTILAITIWAAGGVKITNTRTDSR